MPLLLWRLNDVTFVFDTWVYIVSEAENDSGSGSEIGIGPLDIIVAIATMGASIPVQIAATVASKTAQKAFNIQNLAAVDVPFSIPGVTTARNKSTVTSPVIAKSTSETPDREFSGTTPTVRNPDTAFAGVSITSPTPKDNNDNRDDGGDNTPTAPRVVAARVTTPIKKDTILIPPSGDQTVSDQKDPTVAKKKKLKEEDSTIKDNTINKKKWVSVKRGGVGRRFTINLRSGLGSLPPSSGVSV